MCILFSSTSTPKSKPCLVKRMSSGETSETESVANAKDMLDDKDVAGHVDLQSGQFSLSLNVTRSRLRLSPNPRELKSRSSNRFLKLIILETILPSSYIYRVWNSSF